MNMASDVTRVRASRVWLSAVAIALLLVVSNTAPATAQSTATVMVSNLEEAEYRRLWLNPGQAYAHSFHTGNTAVTLEKVRLYLSGAESTPAVTIRADNSGEPYRSLQALTNPSIDSSIDTYEDFTTTGYVLAANTTYWVVFHRQWGSKPFSFSATLSETGSDNRWCNDLGTPDDPYTSREDGWSLGETLFFGLGSRWREASFGCWSMRMAVYAQTGQGQSSNSPATGGPGITGFVWAGETLTATTDLIEDEDGLTGATFTYQWLADDTDITDATGSTYTLAAADEGKTVKIRLSFTDDRGHQETVTSTATAAVTAAPSPLTVSVESAPTSHNGSEAFRIRVAFSETPESGFSYTTMRDHAFTVTGGDVTGARRLVSGKNLRWEVTVQPSGNADVTVELPVTTDCAAQGAICTDNDEKLSNSLNLTVSGPEATPAAAVVVSALTVSVESAPTSHNGSNSFRIRIALSEAPKSSFSYTTMRDDAFTVTGGDVTGARRLVSGKNLRWEITVQPSGNADVTVELPVTTDCAAQGAICTDNDDKLSNSLNLTVSGPN